MAVRTINWPATVAAVQAVLDQQPPLPQATINSGVEVRAAIDGFPPGSSPGLGKLYDENAIDGISNTSTYALAMQAWIDTPITGAKAAWTELDRVCRAVFQILVPTPTDYQAAVFGMSGLGTWQPSTPYLVNSAVLANPSNGYTFVGAAGTSGSTQPTWTTQPGLVTFDGTTAWVCMSPVLGPTGVPKALPWSAAFENIATLTFRQTAMAVIAGASPGLQTLLAGANDAWLAALAAKPAANPNEDAASATAIGNLQTAIANANAWLSAAAVQ